MSHFSADYAFSSVVVWIVLLCATPACRDDSKEAHVASSRPSSAAKPVAPPPWDAAPRAPAPPPGMVWITGGALVGGSSPGDMPRIADEEMAGEQVILEGFFMSVYPYPNEEGAIPLVNVTQEEAAALCEERGHRLCTELEWERGCKGANNTIYEYGNRYRPEACGTGAEPRMLPSGLRVGCTSDFGVRDMHGGVWEWTSSRWGRGSREKLVTVRGGNARAGELVGRCANAMGRPPSAKSGDVGFRCCAGERNTAEVVVVVDVEPKLVVRQPPEKSWVEVVQRAMRENGVEGMEHPERFKVVRQWYWHPVGNEELVVMGGCAGNGPRRLCGAVVARLYGAKAQLLAWARSDKYVPMAKAEGDPRFLWVYGGDAMSHYRRLLVYRWGRVRVDRLERNVHARPNH